MRAEVVSVLGRPARVWRGGAGPPLVLLQGGMADAALHWAPVWDLLAEAFEVIAPDWPGFGETEALPLATYPAMLDWLAALVSSQAGGAAHVAGNSFGGAIGRLFAAQFPQAIRRLVLINGGGLIPDATAHALLSLPDDPGVLAEVGRASFSREALSRMVADETTLTDAFVAACQANPVILKILREGLAGPPPQNLTPSCPTLVLWGENDRHTPPDMGRIVATSIPGSQFSTVPRAGHLPQVENPGAVADTLIDFLNDVTP